MRPMLFIAILALAGAARANVTSPSGSSAARPGSSAIVAAGGLDFLAIAVGLAAPMLTALSAPKVRGPRRMKGESDCRRPLERLIDRQLGPSKISS